MMNSLDLAEIEKVRNLVHSALAATSEPQAHEALHASLQILDTLANPPTAGARRRAAGSIAYTFYDEECPPYCREIDVRIFYSWSDYDPTDEPSAHWGAQIEEVELVAVRYFDHQGEVATLGEHHRELARELLSAQDERLLEVCTDDGCRKQVGAAPGWYTPLPAPPRETDQAAASAEPFPARLAPSLPTRQASDSRRLG